MKFFNFILFQNTSLYKFKQNEYVIGMEREKNKEMITVYLLLVSCNICNIKANL